jgi:signal transduction histidine kinase
VLQDKLVEQRINVEVDIPRNLPEMWVDPELIRNCLFNFVTNAAQAMPNGGKITLGAEHNDSDHTFMLTFSDEGSGLAPEEIDKIFQPYFTTKEAGIGLGLAITERIIKEHGGSISAESEPGLGAKFVVVLPDGPQISSSDVEKPQEKP